MREPNFFIIGAPKCGTTSLAAWLAEHPNIYMSPIKEPFYFSKDIRHGPVERWEEYLRLFKGAGREHIAVGEASVFYLFSRVAVPTIEKLLPGSQYIVMIRNPVEVAKALHEQHLRRRYEDVKDFQEAWRLAEARRAGARVPKTCTDPVLLDYPSWCLLGRQLKRLYAEVPQERVLVLVLDDVKENPRQEYVRVLGFLGVPDDGREELPAYNEAREWKRERLARAILRLSRALGQVKRKMGIPLHRGTGLIRYLENLNERVNTRRRVRPPLQLDLQMELEAFFARDLLKLEGLLGREFPQWRSSEAVTR
jgi:hypothetical protein